jgi:hypothetical protein
MKKRRKKYMRMTELPLSDRVEDRRGQKQVTPHLTLMQQLADMEDRKASEPESKLAKLAGVDDIGTKR